MGAMFKKGFGAAREEAARQAVARENSGKKLYDFFLAKKDDDATVRFLTAEPLTYYEHSIKEGKNFNRYVCTAESSGHCPFCDDGDRPSFKGAFLIIDWRPYEKNDPKKPGKKITVEGQIRIYSQGATVVNQLDIINKKYGLTKQEITITRTGEDKATAYMFDREDKTPFPSKATILNLLPEKLREEYNGTPDSLEELLGHQLEMRAADYEEEEDEEDRPSAKEVRSKNASRRRLSSGDDEEEQEEEEDTSEEEEDEEEAPRRTSRTPAKKAAPSKLKSRRQQVEEEPEEEEEEAEEEDQEEEEPPRRGASLRRAAPVPASRSSSAKPASKSSAKSSPAPTRSGSKTPGSVRGMFSSRR